MYSETFCSSAFNTLALFVDVLLFSFQGSLERNRFRFSFVAVISEATLISYQVAFFMSTTFSISFSSSSVCRKRNVYYLNTSRYASQQLFEILYFEAVLLCHSIVLLISQATFTILAWIILSVNKINKKIQLHTKRRFSILKGDMLTM